MRLDEQLLREGKYMLLPVEVRNKVINVAAAGAAIGFGTGVIGALPKGRLLFLGAVSALTFSALTTGTGNVTATFNGDYSVGTATTVDADLADANEDNIIDGEAAGTTSGVIGPAVAKVTPVSNGVSAQATKAHIIDNSAGNVNLNLNILIDAADITDATSVDLTVNGSMVVAFINLDG